MIEAARVHRFKAGSGLPIAIPVVDLIEIGAGGGSIARVDDLGLLKVGPRSAGADPGPACYGRGGGEPTVTDANLLLGYLDEDYFLGGRMALDRRAAQMAVARLGERLGLSALDTAWGIHRIANENMAAAARIHAIEKNQDPRRYSLLAFGGAGPAHAIGVARRLDIDEVIFPPGAGVAAALGCLVAPPVFSQARTYVGRLDRLDWARVEEIYAGMERDAYHALASARVPAEDVVIERSVDLRLAGQYHELAVAYGSAEPGKPGEAIASLTRAFDDAYAERYGRVLTGLPIEAVTWRIAARGPQGRVRLAPVPHGAPDPVGAVKGRRSVFFGTPVARLVPTPVYARARLAAGSRLTGPAIVEEAATTIVLHPGDRAEVNPYGALVVRCGGMR
jgi:5-oxoprolinase (ATP-hydrolysing)/N-methylhydantoinase A